MIRALRVILFFFIAGPTLAADLDLPPNARLTTDETVDLGRYNAPSGPFLNGDLPMLPFEGRVQRSSWKIASPGLTPLQIIHPLRTQLQAQGYDIVLDCGNDGCGGFDFRFGIETLPAPAMYVNIRAYHHLTGLQYAGDQARSVVTVLASTSASAAYVQIIKAQATGVVQTVNPKTEATPAPPPPEAQSNIAASLLTQGRVILAELDFESGTTDLGAGPFQSLEALAAFMKENPETRVALVGHTDTVGSLEANIAVSRKRARSVRQRLIHEHGIAAERLDAEGMGYLAPVASNLEAAGRDANRRVEAILLGP